MAKKQDGRKKNGGVRKGAGRPRKADEAKLIEKLDSIIDQNKVIGILADLISQGDRRAMTLYFQYRYGQPKASVDVDLNSSEGFNINFKDMISFKDSDKDLLND